MKLHVSINHTIIQKRNPVDQNIENYPGLLFLKDLGKKPTSQTTSMTGF